MASMKTVFFTNCLHLKFETAETLVWHNPRRDASATDASTTDPRTSKKQYCYLTKHLLHNTYLIQKSK